MVTVKEQFQLNVVWKTKFKAGLSPVGNLSLSRKFRRGCWGDARGGSSFPLLALVWAKRHDVNPNGVWKSCVKSI
ncbi:hypothetical protein, partial [Shewanella intestini]|uniref:hypothetical protein n=1 Tax=Shewanella sp. XMDDZSB0408 TaxID=2664453 RepID=UPI001E4A0BCB